jgi:hypothetical protein
MYDPASRLIVTHRINDERLAETRRAHLLRDDRDDAPTFVARDRVGAGRSLLGRVSAALHHATGPALTPRHAVR